MAIHYGDRKTSLMGTMTIKQGEKKFKIEIRQGNCLAVFLHICKAEDGKGYIHTLYNFFADEQLVVDGKDVAPAGLTQLTLSADTMANMVEGQDYSIAAFIDDEADTVRTIKAKVVTKIISSINDFFKFHNFLILSLCIYI
jgi:hypothetical protein